MLKAVPDQENRILPLVSLRFFLAVWIFVHHLFPVWWMPLSHRLGSYLTGIFVAGYMAVPFFFLLSGFVLTLAYGSAKRMTAEDRKRFWIRRFSRLTPAFYLGLCLGLFPYYGLVMKHVDSSFSVALGTLKDLALDMSYLGVTSTRALVINYSSWTISVEAAFYAIFPFVVPFVFRLGKRGAVLTAAACYLTCVALQLTTLHFHPVLYTWHANQFRPSIDFGAEEAWRSLMMANPVFHFPEFLMGMALARLHLLVGRTSLRADLPLAACAAVFLLSFALLPRIPYLYAYNWLLLPVMAVATFYLTSARGRVIDLLCHPKLLYLGEASYVLYILHTPTRDWVSFLMGHFGFYQTYAQYVVGAVFAVLFTAAAVPLHYRVNVPVTRALYRFLKARFLAPAEPRLVDPGEPEPERQTA